MALALSGCLGPDASQPHHLRVSSYEPARVEARLAILQGGVALHNASYDFPAAGPAGASAEASFGPASGGAYRVVVTFPNGTAAHEEDVPMGAGGWGLYVSFTEGRVRVSTLHGD